MSYSIGLDFSRWNVPLDPCKAIAAGAVFGAARASVGSYYTDAASLAAFDACQAAGIPMSAYHVVADADTVTGKRITASAQIDRFTQSIGGRKLDFPPVLDCEIDRTDNKYLTAVTWGCAALLHGFQGYPLPLIYTNKYWWQSNITPNATWSRYPLWIAQYTTRPAPTLMYPWTCWAVWQYSADGNNLGATYGASSDDIDLDRWGDVLPLPRREVEIEPNMEIEKIKELVAAFPQAALSIVINVTAGQDEQPDPEQPPAGTEKSYRVDTTGKANNQVKVRPTADPTVSQVSFVYNGDTVYGDGVVIGAFTHITRCSNRAIVAGFVETQYLRAL